MTSTKRVTITSSLPNDGRTTTNSSIRTTYFGPGHQDTGFFANKGAVGGTFAAVGIVALVLLGVITWLLMRKRKQKHLDADIVAATTAGAATTRRPFEEDDDDWELALDPSTQDMVEHKGEPSYPGILLSQVGGGINMHAAALGPGEGHMN